MCIRDRDVLLTVPASFDEEARELTRRAAEQAGLKRVTLLEEPQAAFYAWLESQGDNWRQRIKVGDLVLVCDVGGGTTDLSLIVVSEEKGDLTLKRVAVGDHILLGGDNMDLALARVLQQRLEASGNRIDTWQLHGLWHQCRIAKEKLFESPKTQKRPITLLGKGTKLIGGTIKTELVREDLDQVLVEVFAHQFRLDGAADELRPLAQQRDWALLRFGRFEQFFLLDAALMPQAVQLPGIDAVAQGLKALLQNARQRQVHVVA